MDFYERVKNLCKSKELQLIPLLESAGMNYETYRSGKRFNNLPRADEAVRIAEALNTTVEYLVTGVDPEVTPELQKYKDFHESVNQLLLDFDKIS